MGGVRPVADPKIPPEKSKVAKMMCIFCLHHFVLFATFDFSGGILGSDAVLTTCILCERG